MRLKCNSCGFIADEEQFSKSEMVDSELDDTTLNEVTVYVCPKCGARSNDYKAEDSEIVKPETVQWMVVVLFDVGSDNLHDETVFVECDNEPKTVAVPIAVERANEEYCSEEMGKEIVDVLIYERKCIERSFEEDIVKAE
jgi:rubredoxin